MQSSEKLSEQRCVFKFTGWIGIIFFQKGCFKSADESYSVISEITITTDSGIQDSSIPSSDAVTPVDNDSATVAYETVVIEIDDNEKDGIKTDADATVDNDNATDANETAVIEIDDNEKDGTKTDADATDVNVKDANETEADETDTDVTESTSQDTSTVQNKPQTKSEQKRKFNFHPKTHKRMGAPKQEIANEKAVKDIENVKPKYESETQKSNHRKETFKPKIIKFRQSKTKNIPTLQDLTTDKEKSDTKNRTFAFYPVTHKSRSPVANDSSKETVKNENFGDKIKGLWNKNVVEPAKKLFGVKTTIPNTPPTKPLLSDNANTTMLKNSTTSLTDEEFKQLNDPASENDKSDNASAEGNKMSKGIDA